MDINLIKKYSPYLYFDKYEPFFPSSVGCTIFYDSKKSSSFSRKIECKEDNIDFVIEYAIYWDFDIQHLYELEHIWVYVDKNRKVCDCEASFHGRYFKVLLKDKSNLMDETHVKLYSQPGKHAFLPEKKMFELLPDLYTCTNEKAGNSGLIVTSIGKGLYETSEEINKMVKEYLQKYKFVPSMEFEEYRIPENLFVTWSELHNKIPFMIKEKLKEIKERVRYE